MDQFDSKRLHSQHLFQSNFSFTFFKAKFMHTSHFNVLDPVQLKNIKMENVKRLVDNSLCFYNDLYRKLEKIQSKYKIMFRMVCFILAAFSHIAKLLILQCKYKLVWCPVVLKSHNSLHMHILVEFKLGEVTQKDKSMLVAPWFKWIKGFS